MIFAASLPAGSSYELVLLGFKTQTRRLRRLDDELVFLPPEGLAAIVRGGRVRVQVGRTYAVQAGRGEAAGGRIRVLQINGERLSWISAADAVAEGMCHACEDPRAEFFELWDRLHKVPGDQAAADPDVWRYLFELATDARAPLSESEGWV